MTDSSVRPTITYADFERLDIRVGTVVGAEAFPEARRPAYRLTVAFGELGVRRSSAQITSYYTAAELVGKQVACVLNFPPKRIAAFASEVLVLGAVLESGDVVLLRPEREVPDGARVA